MLGLRRQMMMVSGGGLPSDYTQLQWVKSNGSGSYIDLDLVIKPNTDVEIEFAAPISTSNYAIFGVYDFSGAAFGIYNRNDGFLKNRSGRDAYQNIIFNDGLKHKIILRPEDDYLIYDGLRIQKTASSPNFSKIRVAGDYRNDYPSSSTIGKNITFYSFTLKTDNTTLAKLIPASHPLFGVGMYDITSGVLRTSQSQYSFIAGDPV